MQWDVKFDDADGVSQQSRVSADSRSAAVERIESDFGVAVSITSVKQVRIDERQPKRVTASSVSEARPIRFGIVRERPIQISLASALILMLIGGLVFDRDPGTSMLALGLVTAGGVLLSPLLAGAAGFIEPPIKARAFARSLFVPLPILVGFIVFGISMFALESGGAMQSLRSRSRFLLMGAVVLCTIVPAAMIGGAVLKATWRQSLAFIGSLIGLGAFLCLIAWGITAGATLALGGRLNELHFFFADGGWIVVAAVGGFVGVVGLRAMSVKLRRDTSKR